MEQKSLSWDEPAKPNGVWNNVSSTSFYGNAKVVSSARDVLKKPHVPSAPPVLTRPAPVNTMPMKKRKTVSEKPLPEIPNHSIPVQQRPKLSHQTVNYTKPASKPPVNPPKSAEWIPSSDSLQLSPEQQYIRSLVVNQRKSIFFTGNAGLYPIHSY
jgi:hypothetical protein